MRRARIRSHFSSIIYPYEPISLQSTPSSLEIMPETRFWKFSEGHRVLAKIIKKCIPKWTDGLRDGQYKAVTRILDGEDVFWVAATGEGKSAAFQVPAIVHDEISKNPDLYPGISAKKDAVTLLVTPTKGLAENIVDELAALGISAFAYTHANITAASLEKRDLDLEVKDCMYSVVCVNPEHLWRPEWSKIVVFPKFRENIISAGAEEAHLIDEWGNKDFRPNFQYIGTFFRSKLPSTISVFALLATVEPGTSTSIICKNLGFKEHFFHLLRGSNERPNTHFIVEPLMHGVDGDIFHQLLPYLSTGQKTIIHCKTLETVYCIYVYLM
ncbi:hypothetical protein BT96DRAFT_1008117 [Gymnopus androsaceus JB14]|uniref:DNA 3'-5' helicase n=1 Tax=Gymnopus androsaceus JB14 TaxID=1447944 RepID=A0A6A4GFQ0_9AGAR|nr:hypothetical protein BT96DRAFT_1008117 [Gymnopus androsaceus JB14]